MKLYRFHWICGVWTKSPRPPIGIPAAAREEVEIQKAGLLDLIPMLVRVGLTRDQAAMEITRLLELGAFIYGLKGVALTQFVRVEAALLADKIAAMTVAATVWWGIIIAVGVVAGFYLINPEVVYATRWRGYDYVYVMTYRERVWWAYFLGYDTDGRPMYSAAERWFVDRAAEYWGQMGYAGEPDVWDLSKWWMVNKWVGVLWNTWVAKQVEVGYIGTMDRVAVTTYKLQKQYDDWSL